MTSIVGSSAPVTSWWYGQGGAVAVVRRLEALHTLSPAPAPAGLVTARRDELTVTFVESLRSPLPPPWHPAESGSEARIGWSAVDPGSEPDPQHPVYLVVFGTTDEGAIVAMNLAAFSRIRIDGERATATALVSRWILELLATHPGTTIGVTPDVWSGPITTRVKAVAAGQVPDVDVLICGPDLSYTDRAQIVSNSRSRIMIDLGADAAVDTKWTITCGPDRVGQISSGQARSVTATLIVPTTETVDRCYELLTDSPASAGSPSASQPPPATEQLDDSVEPDSYSADIADIDSAPAEDDYGPDAGDGIDFFAPQPDWESSDGGGDHVEAQRSPTDADTSMRQDTEPAPAAVPSADPGLPEVAPIWNRLLGQVELCPPAPGKEAGPREKRLKELMVFLQLNPWAGNSEIVRSIYGGTAADNTVTQQVSLLRARLGQIRPGGPKALPPMRDGSYHLDSAVRSDWMEFERLVEILVETTPTGHLIVAMSLVTGPPLGGVSPKEWPWASSLRDELRDRVATAAVVLARRHYEAKRFSDALEIARKGLWYDTARQDVWQICLQAALDGRDHETFKALRGQYLNTVAGPDRDPAVFELTKQAG